MKKNAIELQNVQCVNELFSKQDILYYATVYENCFDFLGIRKGDTLLVDRVKGYTHGCRVLLMGREGFTLRRVELVDNAYCIMPLEEELFIPILITPEVEKSRVWGVVSFVIRSLRAVS